MSRFRSLITTGLTLVGAACVSAWMAMLTWAETLPVGLESFLYIPLLFLVGLGFGYLLVVIFVRR